MHIRNKIMKAKVEDKTRSLIDGQCLSIQITKTGTQGDYTKERNNWLNDISMNDVITQIKAEKM